MPWMLNGSRPDVQLVGEPSPSTMSHAPVRHGEVDNSHDVCGLKLAATSKYSATFEPS